MAEIYRWQGVGADGQEVAGAPAPQFPTQADAEAWLSQEWETFVEAGAAAVNLMCEGALVYGPMSLESAD